MEDLLLINVKTLCICLNKVSINRTWRLPDQSYGEYLFLNEDEIPKYHLNVFRHKSFKNIGNLLEKNIGNLEIFLDFLTKNLKMGVKSGKKYCLNKFCLEIILSEKYSTVPVEKFPIISEKLISEAIRLFNSADTQPVN